MEQVARNLTDCDDGFLTSKRFLIIDRDGIFSPRFKSIVEDRGVEILLTAYQAPNMNAFAERFVRSIKSECLDQMIFLGREFSSEPSQSTLSTTKASGVVKVSEMRWSAG